MLSNFIILFIHTGTDSSSFINIYIDFTSHPLINNLNYIRLSWRFSSLHKWRTLALSEAEKNVHQLRLLKRSPVHSKISHFGSHPDCVLFTSFPSWIPSSFLQNTDIRDIWCSSILRIDTCDFWRQYYISKSTLLIPNSMIQHHRDTCNLKIYT